MSFNDIVNQELAKKILISAIKENKVNHSYLFFGPEGSGKKLTALEFIKALNCLEEKENRPCDSCSSCKRISKYLHPDMMSVSPSGSKQVIGIDAIRNVEQFAQLKSFEAKYKVVLIDRPEKLTKEAGNSFLKTLEEPPANVIIILLTTFPDKILPTIVSRCQKIKFLSLSPSEGIKIVKERFNLEGDKAHILYFVCSGKIKWMQLWLESDIWDLRDSIFDFLINIFSKEKLDYNVPLNLAQIIIEKISMFTDRLKKEKQHDTKEFEGVLSSAQIKNIKDLGQSEVEDLKKDMIKIIFSIIKSFYADILAINHDTKFIINKDKEIFLDKKSKSFPSAYLSQAIEELERDDNFLDSGSNLSLTFQVMFINLFCNAQQFPTK